MRQLTKAFSNDFFDYAGGAIKKALDELNIQVSTNPVCCGREASATVERPRHGG
jgi:hypothetical protein